MFVLLFLIDPCLSDNWNYTESGADWTGTCVTGDSQSPIEIDPSISDRVDKRSSDLISLKFILPDRTVEASFEASGYTIAGDLGSMTATKNSDSTYYNAVITSIDFHSPSENVINGIQHDLEMQIVMTEAEGSFSYIVFSINFDRGGKDSGFIAQVIEANESVVNFSLRGAFESTRVTDFYMIMGSITAPPCTEQVLWLVDSKIRHFLMNSSISFMRDGLEIIHSLGEMGIIENYNCLMAEL